MIKSDTRGVDALNADMPDTMLEPLIWNQLVAELGELPERPHIEPFDDQPWQQLPTLEDLEELWCALPVATIIMHRLATKAHGGGPDLSQYMAAQWQLADMELKLKKEREEQDAAAAAVDAGRLGENVAITVADTVGGGRAVPRRSKNRNKVGEGRKDLVEEDSRRAPQISGVGGAGKAKRR